MKPAGSAHLRAKDAEYVLWRALRDMKLHGFHFRRQVLFRGYILHFAEHTARLIIELDTQSEETDHRSQDEIRDRVLISEGYRVLRIPNEDVLKNLRRVTDLILTTARRRIGEA
jgi:very-short-patch-repair endonuclease